jgi:hypothetical protein
MYLGEVVKAMFQCVTRTCAPIFHLLPGPKCDFGEVEKAMFQGSPGPETHFLPLGRPKMPLSEFEKAVFLLVT